MQAQFLFFVAGITGVKVNSVKTLSKTIEKHEMRCTGFQSRK